jgi:protein-disulfide isomerase
MDKISILTILVSIALLLSLVNVYTNYDLSKKIDTIQELGVQPPPTPTPVKLNASADDDPVKGSKDAPVTIIEFSDFECPFCERFFIQTLPQIEKDYIIP